MELADFYGALLPPTGHYALFNTKTSRHVWCLTLEELTKETEKRKDELNWYFATGSFLKGQRKQDSVVGKKCFYLDIDAGAEKFAKAPATAWPTIQDALGAFGAFTDAFGIRPTFIVYSGAGLHIYYQLEETIDGKQWTEIAEQFKRVTKHLGLRADPTSTSDSARVLRPIGTLHGNGNRVRILKHFPDAIYTADTFAGAVRGVALPNGEEALTGQLSEVFPNVSIVSAADEVNSDFRTYEPVPTSAVKITGGCGALREVADSKGQVVEPQWRAMLGIVKHCVEGEALAQEWSSGHPDYSFLDTQEKFLRYQAGPPLCETFHAYTDACSSCPHWGKIKSPIVLGRINEAEKQADPVLAAQVEQKAAEAPPAPDPIPAGINVPEEALGAGYRVVVVGGRAALEGQKITYVADPQNPKNKIRTVVWLRFTEDLFWLTGWTEAGQTDAESSKVTWTLLRRGRTQQFELPNEFSADRKTLLKYLAGKTINPLNHEPDTTAMMQQYVNDQIRRVKDAASRPVVRDHLGFHMESTGDLYCAQGEFVIYKDGTIRKATLGHGLANVKDSMMIESLPKTVESSWGPGAWTDVAIGALRQAEFYREWWGKPGLEVAQLAIMLQLASPLLVFAAETDMSPGLALPAVGLTVSLYSSESAKGKTSIQAAASYAFGDAGQIIRQGDRLGMTFNAQVATAAALGTLPFPMDEVTTNDKAQVGESINRIASGIEKTRATKDGTVAHAPLKWALISTVSTNVPQRELVSEFQKGSDALQMRLIELNCDRLPTRRLDIVPEYDAAIRAAMDGTKGSLGAMIHLYIVMKGYKYVRALVVEKLKYVAKLSPGESKERFILKGIAAMLVLADILKTLKLELFDTATLEREAITAIQSARGYSLSAVPENNQHFLKMVRELAPHILITADDISTGDESTPLENERTCRTPYAGRLCRKTNTLYLAVDSCKKWAVENQLSPSAVMDDAKKQKLIVDFSPGKDIGQLVLSKGIRGVWLPKQQVWKINASTLRIAEVIGDGSVVPLHRTATVQSPAALPAHGHSS